MVKKIIVLLILVLFLGCGNKSIVLANDVPYAGYTYDREKQEQAAPALYRPETKKSLGSTENPVQLTDFYVYDEKLYVLDASGSLVWVLDERLESLEQLNFWDENGNAVTFGQARGLFVSERGIYITDTANQCVNYFGWDGKQKMRYEKPQAAAYDSSVPFAVTRVVADSGGNVYALVDGLYAGAVMFSEQGQFLGFYGPNEVEMTMDMLLDQSWKRLLTEEQKNAMDRFVPIAYTSFDIDDENFIYTCSKNAINESTRVRRLNPSGKGLWDGKDLMFGDYIPESQWVRGLANVSQIVDVNIQEDGILSILDAARGRIFLYDENGILLGVFGGKGSQLGTVEEAAAIESIGNSIYVLDTKSMDITRYVRTEYGEVFHEALMLYNRGEYEKASPLWEQVLAQNSYCQLAYTGIGKALMQNGQFGEALRYFRMGGDREEYSEAFETYRFQVMRRHFVWILPMAAAVFGGIRWIGRWREKHGKGSRKLGHWSMLRAPFQTLDELLYHKKLSVFFSTGIVLIWFVLEIVKYFGTGFAFNENDPEKFNVFLPLMSTVGAYILFGVSNWGVSTLSEGKGSMKTIYCSMAYVLLPYLLSQAAILVLSHVFVLEEQAFLIFLGIVGVVWSCILLLLVITTIHDYTLGRAVGNIILTLFGMLVIMFLLFMMVVLFEHVLKLFLTVYNELTLRR